MTQSEPSPYNASVSGREEVTAQLHIIRVVPDAPLFAFKPGQFAVLYRRAVCLGGGEILPGNDEPAA